MRAHRRTETFVATWSVLDVLVQGGRLRPETAQMAITRCRDSWDEARERVMALLRPQRAKWHRKTSTRITYKSAIKVDDYTELMR